MWEVVGLKRLWGHGLAALAQGGWKDWAGGEGAARAAGGRAERRPGPLEPAFPLSSGFGGDRSVRVTGGLPSVWELPLQLL